MPGNTVTIVEDGKLVNIDEDHLRKGDLVVLQAGDAVPADLKLVEARGLEVDEFDITGEIMPVIKKVADEEVMLYMGSRVLRGVAKGTVNAAGGQTEFGKVLEQEREGLKPFPLQLLATRYLGLVILLLPALIIHLARSDQDALVVALFILVSAMVILLQNDALFRSVLIAAELARAGRFDIQIRAVNALADLHSIDVVCFDKTGVLTTRRMEVKTIHFADRHLDADDELSDGRSGGVFPVVKLACALCNDVRFYEKRDQANPVDKALMSFAANKGADLKALLLQYRRVYDVPFDAENRYMACGFERDGQEVCFLKGDPDVVLGLCRYCMTAAGVQKETDWEFRRLNSSNLEAISQQGDIAIALAYTTEISAGTPAGYTFLCLLQLENPLQPRARETVKGIAGHGIRSILLTGDKSTTAIQVGTACGIATESQACLTGKVMDRMEAVDIVRQAAYCSVFARLVPSQKGYLIRLLQLEGHRVAMIGDGPNDGVALKAADVGVSFIDGSSPIARRLAKILIGDLKDLLRLVEGAHRIERQAGRLKLLRIVVIAVSLLSTYVWSFAPR